VPLVQAALTRATAGLAPIDLVVAGLGAFPTAARPRVIWAGIDAGRAGLATVAAGVERELAGIGFPPEERAFAGHVTLGRVREPKRNEALAEALRDSERLGAVRLDRISLMRSELSPRGARYSELSSHLLGSAGLSVHM
jgi:2'-5' RNA ligase